MTTSRLGAAMDVRFAASVTEFLDYITDLGLDHLELKREYLAGHPEAPGPEKLGALAESYDVTLSLHAPFRDWNAGSFNDRARHESAARVRRTLDEAATAGAEAVVVHGGSVPWRYPEWVRTRAVENARRSLTECVAHAAEVGVPLCLENQPPSAGTRRHTTTPAALAETLSAIEAGPEVLGITLDVGHAAVAGVDWRAFVDRFGDRIRVCHLHDNDGSDDDHEPLPDHDRFLEAVPADVFVFETKSVADVARCLGASHKPIQPALVTDD
ncbi:MAG: sugar phosphate isomerase/epimerase family protein [Salinirussus sp.]